MEIRMESRYTKMLENVLTRHEIPFSRVDTPDFAFRDLELSVIQHRFGLCENTANEVHHVLDTVMDMFREPNAGVFVYRFYFGKEYEDNGREIGQFVLEYYLLQYEEFEQSTPPVITPGEQSERMHYLSEIEGNSSGIPVTDEPENLYQESQPESEPIIAPVEPEPSWPDPFASVPLSPDNPEDEAVEIDPVVEQSVNAVSEEPMIEEPESVAEAAMEPDDPVDLPEQPLVVEEPAESEQSELVPEADLVEETPIAEPEEAIALPEAEPEPVTPRIIEVPVIVEPDYDRLQKEIAFLIQLLGKGLNPEVADVLTRSISIVVQDHLRSRGNPAD
jgi:hypothetical protein